MKAQRSKKSPQGTYLLVLGLAAIAWSMGCVVPLTSSSSTKGDPTGVSTPTHLTILGSCYYVTSDFCQDFVGSPPFCSGSVQSESFPCPTTALVGSCLSNQGTPYEEDTRYYAPTYTTAAAQSLCTNMMKGTFTATGKGTNSG